MNIFRRCAVVVLLSGCQLFSSETEPQRPRLVTVWHAASNHVAVGVPVAAGNRAIAAFQDRRVRAFDLATGALLWTSQDLGRNLYPLRLYRSSDSVVIVNGAEHVYGLDVRDGNWLWTMAAPIDSSYTREGTLRPGSLNYHSFDLLEDGRHLVVPAWGSSIMLLDSRTGQPVWTWARDLSHENGHGANGVEQCGDKLVASLWQFHTPNGSESTHTLVALDAQTGIEQWSRTLPFTTFFVGAIGGLSCTATHVFAATMMGPVWAVRLSDGSVEWSNPRTHGYLNSAGPIVTRNLVIVDNGMSQEIVAFRPSDGSLAWRTLVRAVPVWVMEHDDRYVWFSDTYVHILRIDTGERVLYAQNFGVDVMAAPLPLGNGHALLATERGLIRVRLDGVR